MIYQVEPSLGLFTSFWYLRGSESSNPTGGGEKAVMLMRALHQRTLLSLSVLLVALGFRLFIIISWDMVWQVQVPVDVACIGASRETAVLDFSYTMGHTPVCTQP